MELDSSELLKRFVAADAGVGFIARSNVLEDVRAKVLVAIPIADATIRRDLALVFRKDKALSRAALAFIDTTVRIKKVDPVAFATASSTPNHPGPRSPRRPRPGGRAKLPRFEIGISESELRTLFNIAELPSVGRLGYPPLRVSAWTLS